MAIADVSGKSIAELHSLAGRVAVVTGGAQGLGRAMVNRLAEAGASVLILDLRAEQAEGRPRSEAAATGARSSQQPSTSATRPRSRRPPTGP
jgi:NAD(P)-dependent dehydrogenase (short-subunit alcohol dehydrogenase family)